MIHFKLDLFKVSSLSLIDGQFNSRTKIKFKVQSLSLERVYLHIADSSVTDYCVVTNKLLKCLEFRSFVSTQSAAVPIKECRTSEKLQACYELTIMFSAL